MTGPDDRVESWVRQSLDRAESETLDDAELSELLGDELSEEQRGALVDRLIADPESIEKLKAFRPIRAWSDGVAGAIEETRRFRRPRSASLRAVALAAVLLLAIAIPFVLRNADSVAPSDPVLRTTNPASVSIAEPADGARLAAPPARLAVSFAAQPGQKFSALLFDQSSNLLWRSPPLEKPSAEIPAAVQGLLLPGQIYLWRISVDDGLEERLLPLTAFEITAAETGAAETGAAEKKN